MSAELFTNDFQVIEAYRGPREDPPTSGHLGALSLTLEITPPPPEERLATAIAVASIYQLDRPGVFRNFTQDQYKGTVQVDILARRGSGSDDSKVEKELRGALYLYADAFSNRLAAVLNARPEAVLSVVDRLMRSEIIQAAPIVDRFKPRDKPSYGG